MLDADASSERIAIAHPGTVKAPPVVEVVKKKRNNCTVQTTLEKSSSGEANRFNSQCF